MGVSASVHAGIHTPLGRHPPKEQIPLPQSRDPPAADPIPREQTSPSAMHAGRYGQQAGGTHPIGMYTCLHLSGLK